MMKKVFETSYSLVTEENGVVYVKARTRSIMVTALLLLIFGLSAYLLSQVPLTEDGEVLFLGGNHYPAFSRVALHNRISPEFKFHDRL